jgi:hypothetical protein
MIHASGHFVDVEKDDVVADGVTLYSATLSTNALTIAKISG